MINSKDADTVTGRAPYVDRQDELTYLSEVAPAGKRGGHGSVLNVASGAGRRLWPTDLPSDLPSDIPPEWRLRRPTDTELLGGAASPIGTYFSSSLGQTNLFIGYVALGGLIELLVTVFAVRETAFGHLECRTKP
jgi:hypothetical protein